MGATEPALRCGRAWMGGLPAVVHIYFAFAPILPSGMCFHYMAFVWDWPGLTTASIRANNDTVLQYYTVRCNACDGSAETTRVYTGTGGGLAVG